MPLKIVGRPNDQYVRSVDDCPGLLLPRTAPNKLDETTATWAVTPTVSPGRIRPGLQHQPLGDHEYTEFTPDEVVDATEDLSVLRWMVDISTDVAATVTTALFRIGEDRREQIGWAWQTRRACARRLAELSEEVA